MISRLTAATSRAQRLVATTTATAVVVTGEQRVNELARMLSGEEGGEAARRHAHELLGGR